MTKRNLQKIDYDREQLENDTVYISKRETIEDMKSKVCSSLTKNERFAIRYCLNMTYKYFGTLGRERPLIVDGVDLKETLLNLLERM